MQTGWHIFTIQLIILLLLLLPCVSGRLGNLLNNNGLLSSVLLDVIPGQYILQFKREADPDTVLTQIRSVANRQTETATSVLFCYNYTMNGVAMKGLARDTVRSLEQDPEITNIVEVCIHFSCYIFSLKRNSY